MFGCYTDFFQLVYLYLLRNSPTVGTIAYNEETPCPYQNASSAYKILILSNDFLNGMKNSLEKLLKMKINKALYICPGIFCVLLIQYYFYNRDIKGVQTTFKCDTKPTCNPNITKFKHILYWTGVFGHSDSYLGLGSKIFEECDVSNCFATDDRCYLPVHEYDAILFHGREYVTESEDKPENRSQNQYYVYLNQESPLNSPLWIGSDNFFNWTMTYRSDSDIMHPYGYYETLPTNYKLPSIEEIQKKPLKIAWMVSNCNAQSKRHDLYEKLNKYIPIDVYGTCGSKLCPKDNFKGCYDLLAKKYKFYLSFENSICSEYVTEKMYEVLNRNFIPIVYGGAKYTKSAPPNSVIDVSKFSSVKELATYLKSLDDDPEKYLSYFEWKKNYVVKSDHKLSLCTLCRKLNEPIVHKSYDINKWWNSGMCKLGDKLPKILFT